MTASSWQARKPNAVMPSDAGREQRGVVGIAQQHDGEGARALLHGLQQRAIRRVEVRVEQEQHGGVGARRGLGGRALDLLGGRLHADDRGLGRDPHRRERVAQERGARPGPRGSMKMRGARSEKRGKIAATRPLSALQEPGLGRRHERHRARRHRLRERAAVELGRGRARPRGASSGARAACGTRSAAASSSRRGARRPAIRVESAAAAARCAGSVWQTSSRSWPAAAVAHGRVADRRRLRDRAHLEVVRDDHAAVARPARAGTPRR